MANPGTEEWADPFDDLRGRPERYVAAEDGVDLVIAYGKGKNGNPALAIRLNLPDGRAALAAVDLLGMIDGLLAELHANGLRVVIGLAEPLQPPAQSPN